MNPNHASQPRHSSGQYQRHAGHAQHAASVPTHPQALQAVDLAARHHAQILDAQRAALDAAQMAKPLDSVNRPPGAVVNSQGSESYYGRRSNVQDGIEVKNNPASRALTSGYAPGSPPGKSAMGGGSKPLSPKLRNVDDPRFRPGNEPQWKDG